MEIKILANHINLSDDQRSEVERKVEKLSTYAHKIADESSTIKVELTHEAAKNSSEAFVCIITLFVPNEILRAEARGATMDNALDEVIEKLKAPIERYKDKIHHISERH